MASPFTFLQKVSKHDRLLVVLDLDKTLIHSELHDQGFFSTANFVLKNDELLGMGFDAGKKENHVWLRPGLQKFLNAISQVADVIIWTLSDPVLAHAIVSRFDEDNVVKAIIGRDDVLHVAVNLLETREYHLTPKITVDPERMLPKRIFRLLEHMDSNVNVSYYMKDLSVLGVTMDHVVIVEDWPDLCLFNPDNAIIVPEYNKPQKHSMPDLSLLQHALPLIMELAEGYAQKKVDVRHVLSERTSVRDTITDLFTREEVYNEIIDLHNSFCLAQRPWVFGIHPSKATPRSNHKEESKSVSGSLSLSLSLSNSIISSVTNGIVDQPLPSAKLRDAAQAKTPDKKNKKRVFLCF